LRMSDVIVDWRGAKPSITYGLKDNRIKVSIGSLGGWVRVTRVGGGWKIC
jgi:hypothetical protein